MAAALNEWARQRMVTAVLTAPLSVASDAKPATKPETTEEEVEAFAIIMRLLGPEGPVSR